MNAIKLPAFVFTAFFLFFHTPSSPEAAAMDGRQAVIMFKDEVDKELLEQFSQSVDYIFQEIPAASITVSETQKKALQMSPEVESLSYDMPVQSSAQSPSYGYEKVGMKNLVPSTLTGAGVKIGVLDSGIDAKHPDLQKRVVGGTCTMDIIYGEAGCPNSYYDDAGHGTHVAGIIAANNNTFGTIGVAPSASLYAIKVLDEYGEGSTSTLIAGVEWAIKQKLNILNISITSPIYDPAMEEVMKKAYSAGILIVGAAGNTGAPVSGSDSSVEYPAKFESVIAVSSIDQYDKIDRQSSLGKEIELAAPGVKIYSTYPDSDYTTSSGTSMAAPYVSGIAALYKEKYPEMTNKQLRALLQKNAKDLGAAGRDRYFGFGLVQVDKNPVNHDIELPYTTDSKGKLTVDTSDLADRFGTYNVYREDHLVGKNETAAEWTDYASAGTINYYFHPVVNGVEDETSFTTLKAEVASPKIKDLLASKWYDRYITYLNYQGIMTGFEDGTIRPESNITRGEAAILIGKSLGLNGTARNTSFKDVTVNVSSSGYIQSLADAGITNGFTDGTFRPGQLVTRAEMAILISKAYEINTASTSQLKDITAKITGYQYINGVAAAGIAGGYEDGTFRPHTHMNRAQFATFLARAINSELR
ncbi:S8 family serine peptidase [Domibacillus robiginosus]|uniref:S8 family serine peptidase n=1 Tax=Domibacillus robiginosus TaxID=1071054 RepID=UPI00067C4158|nr:S8 family serine peptidase [Domibacillus robiginosus]